MLIATSGEEGKGMLGRPAATAFLFLLACLLFAGCATTPPVQEMSDARQAIQAAREANAAKLAPQPLHRAEEYLDQATARLDRGEYMAAREAALKAKRQAVYARDRAIRQTGAEEN